MKLFGRRSPENVPLPSGEEIEAALSAVGSEIDAYQAELDLIIGNRGHGPEYVERKDIVAFRLDLLKQDRARLLELADRRGRQLARHALAESHAGDSDIL